MGTSKIPRVSVFRSNRRIYAQVIDDAAGRTLVSNHDSADKKNGKKFDRAGAVGEALAKRIAEVGVQKVVFDRGGYKYHGRVKALAEGLRKGGLL